MSIVFRNIIYISFCFLLLSACRGNKKSIAPDQRTDEDIKEAISKHNITYDWFTAVGKIRMTNPDQSMAAKVILRIKRDSAIWMVVKKLNIEIARVLITPKNFTIIYRWEKVYEQEALQTLMESYNAKLSFTELQDYIIGNIPAIDPSDFKTKQTEQDVICQTKIMGLKSFLKLDKENMHLRTFEMFNEKNESIKGEFSNFKVSGEYTLPHKRLFYIRSQEHGDMKAELNLSELQINKPKSMKFSIPAHYERLKYYRPF